VDNGQSALEKTQAHPIDIAIVAVNLPDIDGYKVCQGLKKSGVPVVLLGTIDPVRSKNCNAEKDLPKPFDTETLLSYVQELVTKRQQEKAHERSLMHADPFEIEIEVDAPPVDPPEIEIAPPSIHAINEDTLRRIAREVVEQIAWEVVPKLAESILREQLEKKS